MLTLIFGIICFIASPVIIFLVLKNNPSLVTKLLKYLPSNP
jgi:hypothetical protein